MNNEEKILSMLEALTQGQSETNQRITETNQRLDDFQTQTNQRLDETNKRIADTNQRLDEFQTQTNQRFDKLEKEIKTVKRELTNEIHKTSDFLLDELERRVDFEGWSARQRKVVSK